MDLAGVMRSFISHVLMMEMQPVAVSGDEQLGVKPYKALLKKRKENLGSLACAKC
jgi:hypothetical protein